MRFSTGWVVMSAGRPEGTSREAQLLARLRQMADSPPAWGLADDAAVASFPLGADLVVTKDMLVEGVHFTRQCPASTVGWKLVAVNLSDLAAMGARPLGCLLGVALGPEQDDRWAGRFLAGVSGALERHDTALWGGDTVATPGPLTLSATLIGVAPAGAALSRGGAGAGDRLWVSGHIGDAGLGLRVALDDPSAEIWPAEMREALAARYRKPRPRVMLGLALRGVATALMDVSDGLLLDASRLAEASGLAAECWLDALPRSAAVATLFGPEPSIDHLMALATAGDDYELLFTAPDTAEAADAVRAAGRRADVMVTPIGWMRPRPPGSGPLVVRHGQAVLELPDRLGHWHG